MPGGQLHNTAWTEFYSLSQERSTLEKGRAYANIPGQVIYQDFLDGSPLSHTFDLYLL